MRFTSGSPLYQYSRYQFWQNISIPLDEPDIPAHSPVHFPAMASFLQRATGIARTAAEVVKTRVIPPAVEYAAITKEYVATTMERNAEYVIKDPVAVEKLGYQFVFSNLAR